MKEYLIMTYQEIIHFHDPLFHDIIIPFIDSMPDAERYSF